MEPSRENPTPEARPGSAAGLATEPLNDREPPAQPLRLPLLRSTGWLLVALVLGVLSILWVVQNELVHSSIQVGNSVPPIPTLAAVLLMGGVLALHRRLRKAPADATQDESTRRSRANTLSIYVFLTV